MTRGDAGTCPGEFEFCATKGQAVTLYIHMQDLRSYAGEAWIRCGVLSDGGTP